MKYIKVVSICPLIGKPCINDGLNSDVFMNRSVANSCDLWDCSTYNGVVPDEPCRFKRAINKILSDEIPDNIPDSVPDVPFKHD